MTIGDLALAQTTTSIVSTGAEGHVAALVEKILVAHPSLEVATTQDFACTSISETHVVTSEMRELMVQLAPAILGNKCASFVF